MQEASSGSGPQSDPGAGCRAAGHPAAAEEATDGIHGLRGEMPHPARVRTPRLDLVLHQLLGGGADQEGVGRAACWSRVASWRVPRCGVSATAVAAPSEPTITGPRVQPQAEARHAVQRPPSSGCPADAGAAPEPPDPPSGMIFLRHRRPKQRQEALAGDLGEGPS